MLLSEIPIHIFLEVIFTWRIIVYSVMLLAVQQSELARSEVK